MTMNQVFDVAALPGSPRACQFFMWRNAPNAGVSTRLQLAAAFGFHNDDDASRRSTSATSDLGGANGFGVTNLSHSGV